MNYDVHTNGQSSLSDPIFVFYRCRIANDQNRLYVKIPFYMDPTDAEALIAQDSIREGIMNMARDARDQNMDLNGLQGEVVNEEWWFGDDASNAFIRNRELKRLDW